MVGLVYSWCAIHGQCKFVFILLFIFVCLFIFVITSVICFFFASFTGEEKQIVSIFSCILLISVPLLSAFRSRRICGCFLGFHSHKTFLVGSFLRFWCRVNFWDGGSSEMGGFFFSFAGLYPLSSPLKSVLTRTLEFSSNHVFSGRSAYLQRNSLMISYYCTVLTSYNRRSTHHAHVVLSSFRILN